MPPTRDQLQRLQRQRALFLADDRGGQALPDYWRDEQDLAAYDAVFGARIGWKWDAALRECRDRGFARADDAVVVDYGCGSGVAARAFVAAFGAREVLCHDRSALAMAFAAAAVRRAAPGIAARPWPDLADVAPDVLLLSHVLGELDGAGLAALHAVIARSRRVLLVEAGNKATSRRLGALREALLGSFHVVAPCPAAARCPALVSPDDWCHFFAPPPPEVFTDGDWVRTSKALGIDQRSLPYAFLALDRAPLALPAPASRALGRARVLPHSVTVQLCTPEGLRTAVVQKRNDRETWQRLKRHPEALRGLPLGDV